MNVSLNTLLRSMAVDAADEGDFKALVGDFLAELYVARVLNECNGDVLNAVDRERLLVGAKSIFEGIFSLEMHNVYGECDRGGDTLDDELNLVVYSLMHHHMSDAGLAEAATIPRFSYLMSCVHDYREGAPDGSAEA